MQRPAPHVAEPGHVPQLMIPPQSSGQIPHVKPCCAHERGTHGTSMPHSPGTPPPPQLCGTGHVPQLSNPPHPSPSGPQLTFICAHVSGTHGAQASTPVSLPESIAASTLIASLVPLSTIASATTSPSLPASAATTSSSRASTTTTRASLLASMANAASMPASIALVVASRAPEPASPLSASLPPQPMASAHTAHAKPCFTSRRPPSPT
jgi:hypothetical protein